MSSIKDAAIIKCSLTGFLAATRVHKTLLCYNHALTYWNTYTIVSCITEKHNKYTTIVS